MAKTSRPSNRATCATRCAAAPKPQMPTVRGSPAIRSVRYPISPAQRSGAASRLVNAAGIGKQNGTLSVDQLTPGEIEKALLELRKTRKEATVAGYLGVLRPALRRGVRDGHMASDPTARLSLSFGYPERHVIWSDDDLARVRAAAPAWCSDLLCFLRASGLRVGDALALRWEQVQDGRLRLLQGQEKTGEPLDVPLSRKAVAVLETIPRAGPLVFPGPRKGPRAYNRVLRVVQAAMAAADPPVVGKTIHDLRRSWAVELLEAGVSLELIAALLARLPG